ncbi:MAG: cytochrome-c peroxidase [Alphaproteobacteria bacterium]|nr:cytochrome-c peroxidase [Alphaproteobacteria bacterium]
MIGIIAVLLACGSAPDPSTPQQPGGWSPAERALIASIAGVPELPPSPTNRVADDPDAATLGSDLFFDVRLSGNGEVSCATCHDPGHYFADPKPLSEGLGQTTRHAPTIVGAQWAAWLFWDGRADSLWSQAQGPLESAAEHGTNRLEIAHLVATHYRDRYEALFGPLPPLEDRARFPVEGRPDPGFINGPDHKAWIAMTEADQDAVNRVFANVAKAIEAFERTLLPGENALDRYAAALQAGDPTGGGHLTDAQERGLSLFIGDAGCINCHNGPMLTDDAFHNLGLPIPEGKAPDMGRAVGARLVLDAPFNCQSAYSDAEDCPELRYLNPDFPDFITAFKTPTLRNVAETAPYMHDGRFAALTDVLAFYQVLPGKPAFGHRELTLEPLRLSQADLDALEAFLGALTGPPPS